MRNWKPYSSVARDGEKTAYCSKGNHSVYYGDAFISFKPSKLIWCKECMNTYYTPQPTLFTEEVDPMKCNNNPLNNLKPMSVDPTIEELILWLTTATHSHWAKGGDRLLKSISDYAKKNGQITPKQKATVLPFYSREAAQNNLLANKVWGHELQNNICKWCAMDNEPQVTVEPKKVEQSFTPMTDKQIKFIRDLFKANKKFMTIDEQESLINKMKGHLDGSAVLSIKWGSQAIDKLKKYNTERSAS